MIRHYTADLFKRLDTDHDNTLTLSEVGSKPSGFTITL